MEINDRVKVTAKFNARSTDPITGVQHTPDSFRLIKRGALGTIVRLSPATRAYPHEVAVVKLDGVTTSQETWTELLKKV
jgi:hypothetical protein